MGFDFGQLLDAKLDGVPFFVSRGRRTGGRRTVTHEFPGSEQVRGEDVGRLPQRFRLEAFLVGDNYLSDRDDLIEVLEEPGPKLLVHPLYGEFVVDVNGAYNTDEDTSEAMSRLTVPLVEHGTKAAPRELLSSVPVAASGAINLTQQRFVDDFNPLDFISEVLAGIRKATSKMREVRGKIEAALSIVEQFSAAIDEFDQELSDLLATPTSVASRLTSLFGSMYGLVGTATEGASTPPTPRVALQVGDAFSDFATPVESSTSIDTPRRQRHAKNMAAIQTFMRTTSAIKMAETLETVEYSTAADAHEARLKVEEIFEGLTGDDELPADNYEALEEVRATTTRYLSQRAQRLPQVVTYTVPVNTPAVVLAWRLYGDASRWEELVDRNDIADPLRVPGGTEIEVVVA